MFKHHSLISTLLLSLIALMLPPIAYGGNGKPAGKSDSALRTEVNQWMNTGRGLRFLENKGQMADMQGKALNSLLFKTSGAGADMYVTTSGLSYVFTKIERHKKTAPSLITNKFRKHSLIDDSITEQYCRADMELVGADIQKENIVKEGESEDRTDYYLGGICPDGLMNVRSYNKVTIRNIYPGIDWVLFSGAKGLKYNFIVHPGANPSLIRLKYKWTNKPELQSDGSLKVSTPMGTITEGIPLSYSRETKNKIQTNYTLEKNEISFNVANYNTNETLIIDPPLIWATYYAGGGGGENVQDVEAMQDDGKNVWITGEVEMTSFPTYNPGGGAYFQGAQAGNNDAFILQFNTAGVLKWATYYGGNGTGSESGTSIQSDGTNVWVTGNTSSTNFPTFNPGSGAYFQATNNTTSPDGNTFILQFSTTGVRKWATYYGGTGSTIAYSIQSDGINVWLTGATGSSNLTTLNPGGGAYFQGPGSTIFILKFNTSAVLKWATYYGGTRGDEGNSIYSDGKNVWITGYTSSTDFPTLNPGGGAFFQSSLLLNLDVFILKFDTAAVLKWATYYGGGTNDLGNSIQSDGNNVWVTGIVTENGFPTLNPGGGTYFLGTFSGLFDAFILKFNTNGVRKWATYYGGNGYDGGYTIQSIGNNVWVSGYSTSANFPTFNSGCGFNQDTLHNGSVAPFILQFDTTGVQEWGTYYGTDGEDDGNFASCDGTNLFIAGDAGSQGYPTINPGGGAYYCDTIPPPSFYPENVFIGKFYVTSPFFRVSPTDTICRGDSTVISANGARFYSWSPPTSLSATNIANPIASPTVTTTYTVTGTDTIACSSVKIDSVKVVVTSINIVNTLKDSSVCKGNSITLTASGGTNYLWSTGAITSSIIATPPVNTSYTVSIRNGICTKDTSVFITVNPKPTVTLSPPISICVDSSITLTANGGTIYLWSTGATTSAINVTPLTNTLYTVSVSDSLCTKDTSVLITVKPKPVITLSPPISICTDSSITLTASGGTSYLWSTGATTSSISIAPLATTSYTVSVSNGVCAKDTSVLITVYPKPIVTLSPPTSICADSSIVLTASGGTNYLWSTGATTSSISITPDATTLYTVSVSNGVCAKDTGVLITIYPKPTVTLSPPLSICADSSVTLTAIGGTSYLWSTGATTSSVKVTPSVTTLYTISVSNGLCIKDTSIEVTVNPKPNGNISGDLLICYGNSTTLSASGGTSYIWNTGATTSSIVISPIASTKYSVTVIQNGCADSANVFVTVNALPIATACCDSSIIFGQSVQLASTGGGTYSWYPADGLSCTDCANPVSNPMQTTTYTLTITSDSGCISQEFITIDVNCGQVFVPTAFSPNEDGQNDVLYVKGPCIKSIDLLIFDRWGNKVFESTDINNGWDGKLDGLPMNTGTYVYFLTATMYNDAVIEKKGNVTLLR